MSFQVREELYVAEHPKQKGIASRLTTAAGAARTRRSSGP